MAKKKSFFLMNTTLKQRKEFVNFLKTSGAGYSEMESAHTMQRMNDVYFAMKEHYAKKSK
jgi:hypothetical protein